MPHVAMRAGMTKLYIWTSIASRAHPPTQAPNARRSRVESSEIHAKAPAFPAATEWVASALIAGISLKAGCPRWEREFSGRVVEASDAWCIRRQKRREFRTLSQRRGSQTAMAFERTRREPAHRCRRASGRDKSRRAPSDRAARLQRCRRFRVK